LGVFLHREARDSYWFLTGISFDFFSNFHKGFEDC
jgi:hypothetical protein